MKSSQDGLISPETIRDLLAKSTPKMESSTMAPRTMFRYAQGWVTSPRELTKSQLATALTKAKAKAAPQVAVFDADGTLVGTVDASAIVPIAAAANTAKVNAANDPPDPADAAVEQVAKAIAGARFREGQAGSFTKAAGSTEARWEALLKSIDAPHSIGLRSAVAMSALRFMAAGAPSSAAAVQACKEIALDVGAAEVANQRRRAALVSR
jgi:hypothetical protein